MSPKKVVPVLLLIGAAGAAVWYYRSRPAETDDGLVASGTVEATDAQLGFQLPGRVVSIAPREGDRVRAGQELARLDRAEIEARREQSQAQVRAAEAALAELLAARASLVTVENAAALARIDLARATGRLGPAWLRQNLRQNLRQTESTP